MESKALKEKQQMYCWNCGTRNPDDFNYCGKCGKQIAATATQNGMNSASEPRQSVADAAPMPSNPLVGETRAVRESFSPSEVPPNRVVDEPRLAHDSARSVAKIEPPSAISLEEPPSPASQPPPREQRLADVREFRNPHALPPNRITGPSFLGLSDESSDNSESSYLLVDDLPQRSHWRAWVAIAVLALLGFLIYKQWNAVKAGATEIAQRATPSSSSTVSPAQPQSTVSGDGASATTSSQSSTSDSAQSPEGVDKPESDKAEQSPTASQDKAGSSGAAESQNKSGSSAADTMSAADSKDTNQSDQPSDAKASEDAASDEIANDSADAQPAEHGSTKTAKKSQPAPAQEPQFDNAAVDQAERYLRGQGVRQDCSRAISLLRSAAREGNPRAQVKLGALYATGQCVTQDRAAAYQWLARAQETQPTNSYLQRTMNNLWANMTPEERDHITH